MQGCQYNIGENQGINGIAVLYKLARVIMGNYKKCPRCELNWIPNSEEYCDVCKVELGKANIPLIEDEDEELSEERICPECKVNYLEDGEDVCTACRAEKVVKKPEEKAEPTDDEDWRQFVEEDVPAEEDNGTEISLAMLQEEEEAEDDNEEEEEPVDVVDDFDESITDFFNEDIEDEDDEEDEKDDEDFVD